MYVAEDGKDFLAYGADNAASSVIWSLSGGFDVELANLAVGGGCGGKKLESTNSPVWIDNCRKGCGWWGGWF